MKTTWDEKFVYRSDETERTLPDFLCRRGVTEIEIVFRSKGWHIPDRDPSDPGETDEERSLVEANAYTASGEYVQLSDEEQKAVWELYADEVNQEPLGP